MEWSVNISEVNDIAMTAGKAIMEVYQMKDFEAITEYKSDHSPLTLADRRSHDIICAALEKKYPAIPVISEEGKGLSYEERCRWKYFWLVDPLDGTREFMRRNGEFTVNIALIREGKPILGTIYIPAKDELYFGSGQGGAFKTNKNGTAPIYASGRQKDLIAVGSRSHASSVREEEVLKKYPVSKKLTAGSAMKFCMLAEGAADIYYREGPTMEWDTAAGQAIVEAAGGKVLDMSGKRFTYNKLSLLNDSFIGLGSGIHITNET